MARFGRIPPYLWFLLLLFKSTFSVRCKIIYKYSETITCSTSFWSNSTLLCLFPQACFCSDLTELLSACMPVFILQANALGVHLSGHIFSLTAKGCLKASDKCSCPFTQLLFLLKPWSSNGQQPLASPLGTWPDASIVWLRAAADTDLSTQDTLTVTWWNHSG